MAFRKLDPQPGPRAADLPYDDVGPGLYPDETAIELEEGHLIAVSVESKWLPNGEGVDFKAWARWMKLDGSTLLSAHGQDIETCFTFKAVAALVERLTVPVIAKEMLLAALGEPPSTYSDPEHDIVDAPIVPFAPDLRLNASIRNALKSVPLTGPAVLDAGALLEL